MKVFRQTPLRLRARYDEREARALSRLLLEQCFGLSMADVALDADERLSDSQLSQLEACVQRMEQGEPLQYVVGKVNFGPCTFSVNPSVLIPRPETAELVDIVSGHALSQRPGATILDIGTGSGCIAVTLAKVCPQARVSAWDISDDALRVARANAALNQAEVQFCHQDALCPPADDALWDIIVSNPPYVCHSERAQMEPHVVDHEPARALFVPDDDPLLFYRAIARYAASALRPSGMLFLEINPLYSAPLLSLLTAEGLADAVVKNDQEGKQRFIQCNKAPI